ncbi:MAG: PilZ domain-containing protein [Anaerolineaceae bacterium]|nr:PilZ domain-containing protein [Anaerolineaceae bacterium]
MNDKREVKRSQLIHFMRVFNQTNSEFIGNLGDLSAKGMMLYMETPIAKGDQLSLRMDFPEIFDNIKSVYFQARCIWVQQGENETVYQAGFELLDSSETMLTLIRQAITYYRDEAR